MKKIIAVLIAGIVLMNTGNLRAQESVVQEGEFGIGVGAGHYFGDLNTRARLNRVKMAGTIFFRKNLGNYIAVRVGASFAQLGYSDRYNTHNKYMFSRNLSFNTKVWELTLQGDFNFFRFMPGEPQFLSWATVWRRNFTPEELTKRLATDEHALAEFRAIGAPSNLPAFAAAFSCKAGDPMVRGGEQQVVIW